MIGAMGWLNRGTPKLVERLEERSALISISDPAFASYFGLGALGNYTGVSVNEQSALSVSAVWRAASLIAQTIASLPARGISEQNGERVEFDTWASDPGRLFGFPSFNYWESTCLHLLLHGNSFHVVHRNGAGAVAGLQLIHPLAVGVELELDGVTKLYRVTLANGEVREMRDGELLHIMALSSDGVRGLSPLQVAANSLGVTIAGDRATGKMFSKGAFLQGIITPEDDLTDDEAEAILAGLDERMNGWDNAGGFALVNRKLKFVPWMMTNHDAQFLQSRQFQIEEIARWFGVPPYELMQTEKQTSWGTGIEAQQRGLSRQVIGPWVRRVEQAVSALLPAGRRLEFDFAALERPTPEQEIRLLIEQVNAGLMTRNEARAIRNMEPHPDGDGLLQSSMSLPNEEGGDDAGIE